MKIPMKNWNNYVTRLSAINKTAGRKMQAWIDTHGTDDVEALVDVAYALATRYGEAASATACQMYDETAQIQKAHVPPAEPKQTQNIRYVDAAVRSALSRAPSTVPKTVSELVKRTGAETTLKNAVRDGAYFAWVPRGDTCPFCITLASNGWRKASKKTVNGDHAEHIHHNCNCEFAISFNGPGHVEGYDPDKYREMYDNAEGGNWKDKMNSMRRAHYAANKDMINAQKRAAYAARKDAYNYNKGPITSNLNSPTVFNTDEVVEEFINSIELPNDPFIVEKVINSVRHMPKEDLDFIKRQGLIVRKTKGASSFVRSRRSRGVDGNLKYVIRINSDTDEPFVFAHECAHLAEKANKLYKDPEFYKVLENFANNIKSFGYGEVGHESYVAAVSDLLIEPYQGRTYIDYEKFLHGRAVEIEDLVEYISVGYECYVGDPKFLETKDPTLYNYFRKRGLR